MGMHCSESLFPRWRGGWPASLTHSWGTRRSRWSTHREKRSCVPSGHRGSRRWSGHSVPGERKGWHEALSTQPRGSATLAFLRKEAPLAFLRRPHCRLISYKAPQQEEGTYLQLSGTNLPQSSPQETSERTSPLSKRSEASKVTVPF